MVHMFPESSYQSRLLICPESDRFPFKKQRLNYNGTISSINFDQVPIRIYPDKVSSTLSVNKGFGQLIMHV